MGNTLAAKLPALSNKIYKEWYPMTVLVQSCARDFEGELDLDTMEIDIPVYHDLSVHQTSLKERELKPAPIEFIKASTKRVTIDKGRYSHWGNTKLDKLVNRLMKEDSKSRAKLAKKWSIAAEKELAEHCAFNLGAKQTIDLTDTDIVVGGVVSKTTILSILDTLKAHAVAKDMEPSEFKLFASERFPTICRDAQLDFASLDANATFRKGFQGLINDVDVRKLAVASITTRNAKTKQVVAEYGIWKTADGIQYVVPYKNTETYEITPDKVLGGGTGYQTLEYYDFFNLYPNRLFRVKMQYVASSTFPTKS